MRHNDKSLPPKPDNNSLLVKRISSLENLVWKIYEELDNKIQDVFEDHSSKFKQQKDIITNIVQGFGQEITNIKEEMQIQSEKLTEGLSHPQFYTEENRFESNETSSQRNSEETTPQQESSDEEPSRKYWSSFIFKFPYVEVQFMNKRENGQLEEVKEEASKGTFNKHNKI